MDENIMETFLFKANWFDDYKEVARESYGTIGALDMADALRKIMARLPNTNSVQIRELFCDNGFTFLEKAEWERINREEDI